MNIGFDCGFGDTKVVFLDGGSTMRSFKVPTAITRVRSNGIDLGDFGGGDELVYEGGVYVVGERAVTKAISTGSFAFYRKYTPLMAYYVIREIERVSGRRVERIAAGLPLAYFTADNRQELRDRLSRIEVNGDVRRYDVAVLPQGVGALIDYRVDVNGVPRSGDEDVLVVDIGFNTVDVIPTEQGFPVRDEAGMLEKWGVSRMIDDLKGYMMTRFKIMDMSEQEGKRCFLEKRVFVDGRAHDISDEVARIVRVYVESLLEELSAHWGARLRRSRKVLVVGGGAYCLWGHIPHEYADVITMDIADGPEYANARGFLKSFRM